MRESPYAPTTETVTSFATPLMSWTLRPLVFGFGPDADTTLPGSREKRTNPLKLKSVFPFSSMAWTLTVTVLRAW